MATTRLPDGKSIGRKEQRARRWPTRACDPTARDPRARSRRPLRSWPAPAREQTASRSSVRLRAPSAGPGWSLFSDSSATAWPCHVQWRPAGSGRTHRAPATAPRTGGVAPRRCPRSPLRSRWTQKMSGRCRSANARSASRRSGHRVQVQMLHVQTVNRSGSGRAGVTVPPQSRMRGGRHRLERTGGHRRARS